MKQQFFICPRCRTALDRVSDDRLVCPQDGLEYCNVDGIWRFLLPESQAHYTRFIEEYETMRRAEGHGSSDAEFYRALPYQDLSGNFSKEWAIRARSFDLLVKKLLVPIQANLERSLKVLDLGAGNGWLSNRMAAAEDRVVAVDLLVNEQDGLGAWKFYEDQFTAIQAEFNRIPIMDRFADITVFNASFHYSENYEETLKEAFRATDEDGVVVIMDTPVYQRQESGEKMVMEREAAFQEQYGFASQALDSENFLTYDRLDELGEALGINWVTFRNPQGLGDTLRPLKAMLNRGPEPARFDLIAGYRAEA